MFVLKEPKSGKPTTIFFLYTCNDGRLKISIGESVEPKYWAKEAERCKGIYAFINQSLNKIASYLDTCENTRRITGKPILKAEISSSVKKLLAKENQTERPGLIEFMEEEIIKRESGKVVTGRTKKFAPGTVKHYWHTLNKLKRYSLATGDRLTFESITLDTRSRIIAYFQQEHNHSTNTLGQTIKHLKVFIRAAYEAGLHENLVSLHKLFTVPYENATDIYLKSEELEALAQLNCENGYLAARDWFLIECYTGLRVSDTLRLKDINIIGGNIVSTNEKTGEKTVIPIHPIVSDILQRWGGFPPVISQQKINDYIKELAQKAGITDRVLHQITKGGKRVSEYCEKWQLITNHTGRRSFITRLIQSGVPDQIAMKLAGIKNAATFKKYNKLSAEDVAELAAKLPFFKS